jgi:hypothetical protein
MKAKVWLSLNCSHFLFTFLLAISINFSIFNTQNDLFPENNYSEMDHFSIFFSKNPSKYRTILFSKLALDILSSSNYHYTLLYIYAIS